MNKFAITPILITLALTIGADFLNAANKFSSASSKPASNKTSTQNQAAAPNAQSALEKYLSAPETGPKQDSSQDASKNSNSKAKAPAKIYRLDRSKIRDINQKRLDGELDSNSKAALNSFSFDALLEHTLANSPSLNLTRLDVQSARNELEYQKASRYPELGINANSEYAKRYGARYNSVQIGDDSLVSQSGYGDSAILPAAKRRVRERSCGRMG